MVKTNIQTFPGEVEILSNLHVGSYLTANGAASNVLEITGNVGATFFIGDGGFLSNIATTLNDITNQGNVISNVVTFEANTNYGGVGLVTTSNVGIQNTNPLYTLHVGDKVIFDDNTVESSGQSVIRVDGRINATRFEGDGGLLSNIATTLSSIVNQGNTASNVVIFNAADEFDSGGVGLVTNSNVGIQNTNPTFNLSVGSNLHVDDTGSNVLTVHGNVTASNLNLGVFSITPAYGLNDVCNTSNGTSNVVQFQNATTSLVATSNITAGGNVTAQSLISTSNVEVGDRLKFSGSNVFVDTLRVADVAANLVTYDRTTGELTDSGGTFLNKFAIVSEQPPSDLFANTTTVTNHGGYTLTTSNLATNSNTYNAFDGTANAWVSGDGYIGGANVFHETNLTQLSNLHPTQFGDWLAIEFPYKTTLRHMKLTPLTAAQFPASANIYATNNDLTWTEVNYWKDVNPVTASNVQTITVNATEQFKKYALVATKAAGNSSNVAIQDWQLFTESFSIDGGKVAMAQQAATGGETVMDQHGPHSRLPKATPLRKYPEIAFDASKVDGNDTTNTYVQAGYTVSTDSVYQDRYVYRAFDHRNDITSSSGVDFWSSEDIGGNGYNQSTGLPVSGVTFQDENGTSYTGHYIKLELPKKIKVERIDFSSRGGDLTSSSPNDKRPTSGTFLGSNDGVNWTLLKTFNDGDLNWSGYLWTTNQYNYKTQLSGTVNDGYFSYIVFVIEKIATTNAYGPVEIRELEYYGYEEDPPLGDTSVDTTFTSIMNTPQTTGANVYVDGSLGETFTNRVTGPTPVGTGTSYDQTGKYWELTGELTSNVTLEANTFLEGDQPHAVSVWFNSSNLVSNASNSCIFSLGTEERLDHVSAAFSNTYQTVQKITASDVEADGRFGFATAMNSDGTKFIVGAYQEHAGGLDNAGAAYIYTYNSGTNNWDEQKLVSPDNEALAKFGISVGMNSNGTKVIVGAFEDHEGASDTGAAYIFTYSGGSWDAGTKIVAPDKAASDKFGYSAAMSGDGNKVIVGAYLEDENVAGGATLSSAGSAYIFTYDGSSWDTGTKIVASDRAASDIFGRSVAINSNGTKVIVGADNGEAAYIFTYNGSSWVQQQILVASDGAAGDKFGYTVAMNPDGTKVIVGAYLEHPGGLSDAGAAYVFTYSNGSWDTGTKIVAPDKEAGDRFGIGVSMNSDGTKVIVGAQKEHAGGITDTGAAYIFAYDGSNWDTGLKITAPDKAVSDTFSSDKQGVAMSGDGARVVVGAYLADPNNLGNAGAVYVYDRDTTHHLTTDLKLQSNTWHNLTYAYQGEGGSRVTYLDGRKVAEDQAEDTFGEYPPFEIGTYSLGGYTVDASYWNTGGTNREAFNIFRATGGGRVTGFTSDGSGAILDTADANYDVTLMTLTDTSGTAHLGHWVSLELPYKLSPSYCEFEHYGSSYRLKDFVILGSNYDPRDVKTGFTLLFSGQAHVDNNGTNKTIHTFTGSGKFKYLILLTKTLNSGNSTWIINRLQYYGHRENDLVRLPDPTNVLKYPHIAMTGPAQRGYVVSASADNYNSAEFYTYSAFNNIQGNEGWHGGANDSTTVYHFSANAGGSIYDTSKGGSLDGNSGEWLKLELPHKIVVDYIKLKRRTTNTTQVPKDFKILGSNNDVDWDILQSVTGASTDLVQTHTIGASTGYKYLAILVTRVHGTVAVDVVISELEYYGTEEATPVPIQIGGGNIDKVANFRVYDTFIDENQALEIWDAQKDEFGRAKSSMTLQKGRLGIGTDEPQGRLAVLDEPHNLEEFPPRAMTAEETYMEGHGVFKAFDSVGTSKSSAFNKNPNDLVYISGQVYDETSPYSANTLAPSTMGTYGSWIQLNCPYGVNVSKVLLSPRNGYENLISMASGYLFGSNDEILWDEIYHFTNIVQPTKGDYVTFNTTSNSKYYKYLRLVCTNLAGLKAGDMTWQHAEIRYFGTREQGQSVLHDGALTLTKNLDVPRIGPPLDADDTPRRDRLVVEYNTSTNPTFDGAVRDTSGRGNDGIMYNGASYDATEKALVFNGGDQHIITHMNNKGDTDVSISFWIKRTADTDPVQTVVTIGTITTGKSLAFDIYDDGANIYWWTSGGENLTDTNGALQFPIGTWVHVTGTRTGRIAGYKLYINGVDWTPNMTPSTGTALTLPDNAQVTIGSRNDGTTYNTEGNISNFKLYDTALTAEEVKTLYDMGRTGSVANPKPLHIAAPLYAPGTIVQVEQSLKTDTFSTTGASNHPLSPGNDVPGLAITIHPKFANSRILVSYTVSTGAYGRAYLRIQRKQGGSTTTIAPTVGVPNSIHGKCTTSHSGSGDSAVDSQSFEYYDTIGGTEPITYQIQAWTYHASYYICINKGYADGNNTNDGTYWARTLSSITAKEVCQ